MDCPSLRQHTVMVRTITLVTTPPLSKEYRKLPTVVTPPIPISVNLEHHTDGVSGSGCRHLGTANVGLGIDIQSRHVKFVVRTDPVRRPRRCRYPALLAFALKVNERPSHPRWTFGVRLEEEGRENVSPTAGVGDGGADRVGHTFFLNSPRPVIRGRGGLRGDVVKVIQFMPFIRFIAVC